MELGYSVGLRIWYRGYSGFRGFENSPDIWSIGIGTLALGWVTNRPNIRLIILPKHPDLSSWRNALENQYSSAKKM